MDDMLLLMPFFRDYEQCLKEALGHKYNVTLVPTTVFKNQDGRITKRVEGTMKPEVFESYTEELINE